jgi:rRNA pseudouridine-1189 N-methylase Emg1 (Nep1/Mra1 family)
MNTPNTTNTDHCNQFLPFNITHTPFVKSGESIRPEKYFVHIPNSQHRPRRPDSSGTERGRSDEMSRTVLNLLLDIVAGAGRGQSFIRTYRGQFGDGGGVAG